MNHITSEQRYTISAMLDKDFSQSQIADTIGKSESSVSREIRRNKNPFTGVYDHLFAQWACRRRHKVKAKHRRFNKAMETQVKYYISNKQFSPEQIAGEFRRLGKPIVSHERIYQYIWQDKDQGGDLYKNLRRQGKKYKKRGSGKSSRGRIKNQISIEERPEAVEERSRFGDLEIDTIIGKQHKGAILTINDRKTGILRMKKLATKSAKLVEQAACELLEEWKPHIKTITSDNGSEFAYHQSISEKLEIDFYFAHPYHSWERGSNENLNGLVRQYIPKSADFDNYTKDDIREIEQKINHRPRKRFDYKSPILKMKEVIYKDLHL